MGREVEQHQERIAALIALWGETLDELLRCPPERLEASAQEALRDLKSHAEAVLKEFETIEELKGLTTEEHAQRRAFERFCQGQERAAASASLV